MRDTSVAARYAKALLLLVRRHTAAGPALLEQLDRVVEDLRGLAGLVSPGTRMGELLAHPQVRPDDRRALLRKALDGRADRAVVVFADLLLRKKRLALMPQVLREFEVLVEGVKGVQHAQVFSAVPLAADELSRLHASLEKRTGKKITLGAVVDATLVGGAYVRIGDRIIDRSVRTLLQTVATRLHEAGV